MHVITDQGLAFAGCFWRLSRAFCPLRASRRFGEKPHAHKTSMGHPESQRLGAWTTRRRGRKGMRGSELVVVRRRHGFSPRSLHASTNAGRKGRASGGEIGKIASGCPYRSVGMQAVAEHVVVRVVGDLGYFCNQVNSKPAPLNTKGCGTQKQRQNRLAR